MFSFFVFTLIFHTLKSDLDVEPHITGPMKPGFVYKDDDEGGLCMRFDQSYELGSLGENQCLIQNSAKVAGSVRNFGAASWVVIEDDDDHSAILSQNKAATGAKSIAFQVSTDSDDKLKYSFTVDGYDFVGGSKSNYYVMEVTLGLCGKSITSNKKSSSKDKPKGKTDSKGQTKSKSNKNSKSETSTDATNDSKSTPNTGNKEDSKSAKKVEGANTVNNKPDSKSAKNGNGANDATTNSQDNTKDDDGTNDDGTSTSTSTSTSNDGSTSTSKASKNSKTSRNSKSSKKSNSKDETSDSSSSDSNSNSNSADAESQGVKKRILASSKGAIAAFLQSIQSKVTCEVNGQSVRKQLKNVVCISNSGTKFRVIVQNFHGCRVVSSPSQSLNAGSIIAAESNTKSGVFDGKLFFSVAAFLAVALLF